MRKGTIFVALLLMAARNASQAEAPAPYDLAACIQAALTNSPDLSAAAADLAGARARLSEAKAGRYGQSEYTQVLGFVNQARGTVLNPNPEDKKNDVFNGLGPFTRLELDINVPLWTFGKLAAALAAAQQGLESEQAHTEMRRAEVILNTKQLYYGLMLTRQLSGVLHEMLDTMGKAVSKTQERLDAGSSAVTEIDLLKLKAGRAKLAKGVIEVDAAAILTRSALARAIGAPADGTFDIADRKLRPVAATINPLDTYLAEGPERRPETRRAIGKGRPRSGRVLSEFILRHRLSIRARRQPHRTNQPVRLRRLQLRAPGGRTRHPLGSQFSHH